LNTVESTTTNGLNMSLAGRAMG